MPKLTHHTHLTNPHLPPPHHNYPPSVSSSPTSPISDAEYVGGDVILELHLTVIQKCQQLFDHGTNIVLIDEGKGEFQRSAADRNVVFFEAFKDGVSVALYCVVI